MPKEPSGPSYQATWAFGGIGLLVILFYWMAMTGANQPATPAPPKLALDDAAKLIANCGKPDRDVLTPVKLPKVPERRWLLYRSAKITAVFNRAPQQGTMVWKNVRYFDHISKKQLNPQQVAERLPCAMGSTRSQ